MTLVDSYNICPYTGLRSFTEEESLYFKGRDEQIDQICQLLEKNKFLMITGASGEGKSSLVYAGLIPNARAGFFKAKYNNWVVVDFRPERSPLENLSKSLAEKLSYQKDIVTTELKRGYSSLIDLYKNSEYYIDEDAEAWSAMDDDEKSRRKRSAANLLVLVDQFEEFFTNPENYHNGKTSVEAQIVVNLILETSKLSLQHDLPIYVATTMRSDYIGQCSSFRGLPEHIGFSQFFVPRLKRKELKQVIEEPAMLSGNRISNRLVERLVYDISEGIDQLPILQHALSQIWLVADQGNEEMDLIHYAMVGGMPVKELPEEDQKKFVSWYRTIPEYQHAYYHETGLNRIIEIHASRLYESAWEYYNERHPDEPISQKDGKNIVAMTFACLTKIDNSRAVRNRMTVEEITNIINRPGITEEVVAEIVNLFRMEGNSFIRPFLTEEESTHTLTPDSVLDITHESLIRNWRALNKWANTEFEYYSTFLDFQKQLNRWKENGKSRSFLLPIGPLNYFENWYDQCKPNIWWINRYGDKEKEPSESLKESKTILDDTREFLKRSARKVMVTRAFMRYGAQKIATFAAILIMLALSGFYWYDAEEKKNASVLEDVRNKASMLLNSVEIDHFDKSFYLLIEERLYNGSLIPYLKGIDDIESRLGLSVNAYMVMKFVDKKFNQQIKFDLIDLIQEDLNYYEEQGQDQVFFLEQLDRFILVLAYDNYYISDPLIELAISRTTRKIPSLVSRFYRDLSLTKSSVSIELNEAISLWLTFGDPQQEELSALVNIISPFANESAKAAFDTYYKKGSYEPNGRQSNDHSGGYHMLATLYAALGDIDGVIECFENLDEQYFIGSLFNNYNNVLGYFYQYDHRSQVPELIRWLYAHYPSDTPTTIYRNMVIRSGYITQLYPINLIKDFVRSHRGYFQVNLCLGDRTVFREIVEDYEKEIMKLKDPDERNFLMAFNLKRIGIFEYKYHHDRGSQLDPFELEGWFDEAMDYYKRVSPGYLNEEMDITHPYWGDGIRRKQYSRKHLFIYPDYMDGWFSLTYQTDGYFDYLKDKNLLDDLYTTADDLEMMHLWISQAHEVWPNFGITFTNTYTLPDNVLIDIIEFVDGHPQGQSFDKNLLEIILANRAYSRGDTLNGMKHYHHMDFEAIVSSSTRYEYLSQTFFLNQLKDLSFHLASIGNIDASMEITEYFQEESHKTISYVYNADKLYDMDYNPDAFIFLDSAFSKMANQDLTSLAFNEDYRFKLIHVLSKMGGERLNAFAKEILRDIPENDKFDAVLNYVWGAAADQNYYNAVSSLPKTLTESQELECYQLLLWETCKQSESYDAHIGWESMDFIMVYDWNYFFFIAG